MMVVITILVIFTGVIGINVARAMREQQFNTEVGLIVERLRLAQNLMLIMDRNVRFKVHKPDNGQGLEISLNVEGGVPKEWQFVINHSRIILTSIHSFQFDDLQNFPITPGEIDIRFLSGGTVMSRGVIHLSTHENPNDNGVIKSAIILYGYPHPIESVLETDKPIALSDEENNNDDKMTFYTVEELKQYEAIQKSQKQSEKPQPKPEGPKPPKSG